ncbi:MAG: MEDS domain-containing protein [Actinoplanes sp.]
MAGLPLLDRVAPGDHVCWAVDDDRVRLDAIAAYVQAGLRARQKVAYCGDDPEEVLTGIADRGVATREPLRTGQLQAVTPEASYLAGGSFDAEATIGLVEAGAVQARREGYPGMRVIGDMSWAQRRVPGAERLAWYEATINTLFTEGYLIGVCAYDRRLFDPALMRRFTCAHPGAATTGMPYNPSISLRIRRTLRPYGLRLSGEADLSNRAALAAVIEQVIECKESTIDVSELRFADMAAARILVDAATAGPGRLRVVGCSPTLVRLLRFQNSDAVPGLIVEARR